jgi:CubicO group peptidase (beta-lactamase class C family)
MPASLRLRAAAALGAVVLVAASGSSCARAPQPPPVAVEPTPSTSAAPPATRPPTVPRVRPEGDFSGVVDLMNAAVRAPRLPGAVVEVGHGRKVVFRQAFGVRKFDGEPGLDGRPAPAEAMTEDTVFDLASLTKILVTATAVLQLYEQGRVRLDEPVQTYLPEFNAAGDPRRAQVTPRMLLTHFSGIGGDLSRQGLWGLPSADRAEGVRRALSAPLEFPPGEVFHYSDIGFIVLGVLVENLTGETLDAYARDHIFAPMRMADAGYLPASNGAVALDRVAPTARDEDSPGVNPNIGRVLRGTVHDPTARRMGGVTGSAGAFATVHDLGRYARALLDRLAGRPSTFPLQRSTLELMTTPQQPGHHPGQAAAAESASRYAALNTPNGEDPLLAPSYPAIAGQDLRGFGWDIDTYQSMPRGLVLPVGSFGHTGFTGVTLWIDPGSQTYVIVLANVIHQRGGPPIADLSGEVATLAARALNLYGS